MIPAAPTRTLTTLDPCDFAPHGRGFRRLGLVLAVLATLVLPPGGAQGLAAEPAATADRTPPLFDHSLMLVGCTGGLALGALSVVFPPMAAGMWMGGLGVMVLRAGLGCAYGGLAGAVASAARTTVRWSESEWRAWTGQPTPTPPTIEGPAGT